MNNSSSDSTTPVGREMRLNHAGRFESTEVEIDWCHLEHDKEFHAGLQRPATQYYEDTSRTVISENTSPDIPFQYSWPAPNFCTARYESTGWVKHV